jgi:hypothetical protein
MKFLLLLLLIPVILGLNLKECVDHTYKNMDFHLCNPRSSHVYFHDVTGENSVRLVNNKLYRNHGKYTAMFKNNRLFIGRDKYTDVEWFDAFENLSV